VSAANEWHDLSHKSMIWYI